MHTDLSAHLHTDKCNELIEMLHGCHRDHPIRKFVGICNSIDHQMVRCLKEERLARRARNVEKSNERKKRVLENLRRNEAEEA